MKIALGTLLALAASPALAHNEGAFASASEHAAAHLHAFGGWEGIAIMLGLGLAAATPAGRRFVGTALRAATGRRR